MILGYTKKSFFKAVLHSNVDPSLRWYADTIISILDQQSEKQKARRAARYEYYNRPLMVKICRFLASKKDTPALAVAMYCDITVQKAVGLLRKLARDDGLIEISHHGKARNTYNLAEGITFLR
jgi:hypothetical protein